MTVADTSVLTPEILEQALSYEEYRNLMDRLLDKQKTTGENHSEERLHYTKMNLYRMRRLDKYAKISPELKTKLQDLDRDFLWIVLTEGWSGDAAQNIPVINKIAEFTPRIELKMLLRDENLNFMDQFLTDGKNRSIPKLVCLDARTHKILGTWGPRPETAQQMAVDFKNNPDFSIKHATEELHKWYADDKNEELQREFLALIGKWENT